MRRKAAWEIKRDALATASRKRVAGCEPCQESYVELARENGATPQDIAIALREFSRRDLLMSTAATAGAAAALGAFRYIPALAASVSPSTGTTTPSDTGWLVGLARGATPSVDIVAIDPHGQPLGQLQSVSPRTMLSRDAQLLLEPTSDVISGGMRSRVNAYGASDGTLVFSMQGQTLSTASADRADHESEPYISPDGRWLALLRSLWLSWGGAEKAIPSRREFVHAVEIFDLSARRTVDMYVFPTSNAQDVSAEHLLWSPDSAHLFEFSRRFTGVFTNTVTEFAINNGSPSVNRILASDDSGARVPVHTVPSRYVQRIAPDNSTLIRYVAGPSLERYDVDTLVRLSSDPFPIRYDTAGRGPSAPLAAIAPDAATVVVADGAAGDVWAFDVITGALRAKGRLPGPAEEPREPLRSASHVTVAFDPSGQQVLVVDNRLSGTGGWVIRASDLVVEGHLLEGHPLSAAAWVPDGSNVVALSRLEGLAFSTTASAGVSVANPMNATELLRPGGTALLGD